MKYIFIIVYHLAIITIVICAPRITLNATNDNQIIVGDNTADIIIHQGETFYSPSIQIDYPASDEDTFEIIMHKDDGEEDNIEDESFFDLSNEDSKDTSIIDSNQWNPKNELEVLSEIIYANADTTNHTTPLSSNTKSNATDNSIKQLRALAVIETNAIEATNYSTITPAMTSTTSSMLTEPQDLRSDFSSPIGSEFASPVPPNKNPNATATSIQSFQNFKVIKPSVPDSSLMTSTNSPMTSSIIWPKLKDLKTDSSSSITTESRVKDRNWEAIKKPFWALTSTRECINEMPTKNCNNSKTDYNVEPPSQLTSVRPYVKERHKDANKHHHKNKLKKHQDTVELDWSYDPKPLDCFILTELPLMKSLDLSISDSDLIRELFKVDPIIKRCHRIMNKYHTKMRKIHKLASKI